MHQPKVKEGGEGDNIKQQTCLNSILEEGSEAVLSIKLNDADEGTHFLPQPSPNKKPPSKVASQKGYIDYIKRTSLLNTINRDAMYTTSTPSQHTQRFTQMKKKLSAADYLKPTSMTTIFKIPSIEKEEVDNLLPSSHRSNIKENIVKTKESKQYLHINQNLKAQDEVINSSQSQGSRPSSLVKTSEKSEKLVGPGVVSNNIQGKSQTNVYNNNSAQGGSNLKKVPSQKFKNLQTKSQVSSKYHQQQNKGKITSNHYDKQAKKVNVISPTYTGVKKDQISPKNYFSSTTTSPVKRLNSERAMFNQKNFEFPKESKGELSNFTLTPVEDFNSKVIQTQNRQNFNQDQSISEISEPPTNATKLVSDNEEDNVRRTNTYNVENTYKLLKNFQTESNIDKYKELQIKVDFPDNDHEQSDHTSHMKLQIDQSKTLTSGNTSLLSEKQSVQSAKDCVASNESDFMKQLPKVKSTRQIDNLQLPSHDQRDKKSENVFQNRKGSNLSSQGSLQGSNYKRFSKFEIKPSQGDQPESAGNSPTNRIPLNKESPKLVQDRNSTTYSQKVGSPNSKFIHEQLKKEQQKSQTYKRQVMELEGENQKLRQLLNFILQSKLTDQ